MSDEIQKDDMYLKGDLGTVWVNGVEKKLSKIVYEKTATTITIGHTLEDIKPTTEDAEFEIIPPKQIDDKK